MNVSRIIAVLGAVGLVAGSAMAQSKVAAPVAASDRAFLEQGTVEYGGSIGYSSVNINQRNPGGENGNLRLFKAVAEVDYFLVDNLSVGLAGNFDYARGVFESGANQVSLLSGELVGRWHFPVCNDLVIPYIGAAVGAGYATYGGTMAEGNDTFTSWGFQGGFLVPLNPNVMLDTCLKYTTYQLPGGLHTDLANTQLLLGFKMVL